MENENNKNSKRILYIIIGALVAVIVVLAVLVGILLIGKRPAVNEHNEQTVATNGSGADNKGDAETEPSVEKNVFANEVEKESASFSVSKEMKFVVDGFEFVCPPDYELNYADGVGTYVYASDVFQMRVGIRDRAYQEYVDMGDEVMQKAIDAGGKTLQGVKETTINGADYLYFLTDLEGDKCLVAYTKIPNSDKSVGCNLVVENENLSDEDLLGIFDKIVSTAVETDKPNSTLDDIIDVTVAPGEVKEETVLKHGNSKITVKVPEGFYSSYEDDSENYVTESFCTDSHAIMLDCFYYPEDPYFGGAEGYIQSEMESLIAMSDDNKNVSMEKAKVAGRDVYYVVAKYKSDDSDAQRVYAAVDLGKTGIYQVEAVVFDEDVDLQFKTIEKFFDLKEN